MSHMAPEPMEITASGHIDDDGQVFVFVESPNAAITLKVGPGSSDIEIKSVLAALPQAVDVVVAELAKQAAEDG